MNRRIFRRKPADLKRTLHFLDEDEEMAQEIMMADLETEIRPITITKEMETLGEIRLAKKRYRKDISLVETFTLAREI
jgi:hypothetical protein